MGSRPFQSKTLKRGADEGEDSENSVKRSKKEETDAVALAEFLRPITCEEYLKFMGF